MDNLMTRTDLNVIMDALRPLLGSPGLAEADRVKHSRGKITFDSKALRLPAPARADGLLIGSAFGVPIFRSDALADGIYEYHDEAGTLLSTNA